jgi:hypothetical protein
MRISEGEIGRGSALLEGRFTEFGAESVAHSAERKGQGAGGRWGD